MLILGVRVDPLRVRSSAGLVGDFCCKNQSVNRAENEECESWIAQVSASDMQIARMIHAALDSDLRRQLHDVAEVALVLS